MSGRKTVVGCERLEFRAIVPAEASPSSKPYSLARAVGVADPVSLRGNPERSIRCTPYVEDFRSQAVFGAKPSARAWVVAEQTALITSKPHRSSRRPGDDTERRSWQPVFLREGDKV